MKCKNIKELLLSDYMDNEIDAGLREKVRIHLGKCEECRQFNKDLSFNIVNVLRGARRPMPGPELWYKIKDSIAVKNKISVQEYIIGILKESFTMKKRVYAVAAVMLFMAVTVIFSRGYMGGRNELDRYLTEQMAFVFSLDNGSAEENYDIGIPFEDFSV